tara:strand:- start:957 stop:2561 length:1605 start_codon:yes stop_codon:yes gene_type:complete
MNSELKLILDGEISIMREKYENKISLLTVGDEELQDSQLYLCSMLQVDEIVFYRQPFAEIGTKVLINHKADETHWPNQLFLYGAFYYFNEVMELLYSIIIQKIKTELNKNPYVIFIPKIQELNFLNSKVEYLKVLKENGFINNDTQILLPPVNLQQDSEIFTTLNVHLKNLKDIFVTGTVYEPTKKMKTNWEENKCVIKLPYSGTTDCVIFPNSVRYDDNIDDYIFWLAVYLISSGGVNWIGDKIDENYIYKLRCLGFTKGIIVDRYNPLILIVGEFRTFVSNGDIIGISYSSTSTGSPVPLGLLFYRNHVDESGGEPIYNHRVLSIIKKAFIRNPTLKKHWDAISSGMEEKGDIEIFESLILNQIKTLTRDISALLDLDSNRLDFCLDHSILGGGKFKLMINEVEDMTYGAGSTINFTYDPIFKHEDGSLLNMKNEQLKHLIVKYPEKLAEIKRNQTTFLGLEPEPEQRSVEEARPWFEDYANDIQSSRMEGYSSGLYGGGKKKKNKKKKSSKKSNRKKNRRRKTRRKRKTMK